MARVNRTIPQTDPALARFVRNFAQTTAADWASLGLSEEESLQLSAQADEFIEKYVIARRRSTRTAAAVQAKNTCRTATLALFRAAVRQVRAHPGITDAQLTNLEIVIPHPRKSATPPPGKAPTLFAVRHIGVQHEIIWFNEESQTRRHKPKGATHLVLLRAIGDQAQGDASTARYLGCFSRNRIRITLPRNAGGQRATYWAAWVSATGAQSSWSTPVTATIPHIFTPVTESRPKRELAPAA